MCTFCESEAAQGLGYAGVCVAYRCGEGVGLALVDDDRFFLHGGQGAAH
ncbi:hypothetical protein CFELI_02400 [Corynebacterium felinum]|uniref:Uncharacterized protein n=1 Tax=Corynebacterium felinum TaxID=131318 RepID=A0ABU2B831_9CORY|nr:hypothetical protein [Corynebacterium felinum]WJY94122.1 hypothetical protein CFELI_02400 [Corynebacterium felinum]